ncbi:MAG: phosphatidylserine synthase [Acidobacteria bacterium]|nr:MAG: phosphatidylserine synthase [Acidobacteriota bacterium]
MVKLLIQPGDGVDRLVKGIKKAKKTVEIVIFRFDRPEIERALVDAVERGVFVHALIAFTNRGGEENLRKLELHLLDKGITVARTAGDLVRYHGKMMLVDQKELYVLAFNFTHLDIDHSRSFGLITRNPKLVQEAGRLFNADTKRQVYKPGHAKFLVSPVNAREELAAFVKGAKKELLIYDPKVSDRAILRLLNERLRAGVEIRVIGHVSGGRLPSRELKRMRLHTRVMIRDRRQAFLGSQSLRQLELDARREIGVIFRDRSAIAALLRVFKEDWAASEPAKRDAASDRLATKTAKKVAKVVRNNISAGPVVKQVVKAVRQKADKKLTKEVEQTVKAAVKVAIGDSVKKATKEAVKTIANTALEPEVAGGQKR